MKIMTRHASPLENGREVIVTLRTKAEHLAERRLPAAAAAVQRTGERATDLAVSATQSITRKLEEHLPRGISKRLETMPLLRTRRHRARRNAVLLTAAGVAIAAIGYLAWRHRSEEVPEDLSGATWSDQEE